MPRKKGAKKKQEKKQVKEPQAEAELKEKPKLEEFIELEELKEEVKEEQKEKEELLVQDKKEEAKEKDSKKAVINAILARERVLTEATDEARSLYDKSAYGQVLDDGRVQLALPEALYLLEKGKIQLLEGKKKKITKEEFIAKARKVEPNFWIRYCVFKDMRNRGYIIKTALKFGADFRVYDRGVKPGEDHARWIIFPVHEGETLTWYEFAAKNRVAHSTKKRLMMGIVDDEGDVTYYEIKWMRP
ncbi:tRNA-intron lyase [Candidatus Woesearchaeota archaeon]|nr:tRNA-intron lyase [Candidatus Woesearchaeota archaeon]